MPSQLMLEACANIYVKHLASADNGWQRQTPRGLASLEEYLRHMWAYFGRERAEVAIDAALARKIEAGRGVKIFG